MGGAVVTGNDNIAVGSHQTLDALTSGTYNVAIGSKAGSAVNTGNSNTVIGFQSGLSLTTASGSIAIGSSAMAIATTGNNNIAIGNIAANGGNTTGDNNIVIGTVAGDALTSGKDNIFIGRQAGVDVTTAIRNIFIGLQSGHDLVGGDGGNTGVGAFSLDNITTGKDCTALGYSAKPSAADAINQTMVGKGATGQANHAVVLGDDDVTKVYMSQDGDAVMYANGTINTSDERLKENIDDSDLGLEFVNKLRPVSYKFKKDKQGDQLNYGIIAQEVQEVLKETNNEDFAGITNKGEYLGADYVQFIAPLIKSVQELTEKVEAQQKEIEELKKT